MNFHDPRGPSSEPVLKRLSRIGLCLLLALVAIVGAWWWQFWAITIPAQLPESPPPAASAAPRSA